MRIRILFLFLVFLFFISFKTARELELYVFPELKYFPVMPLSESNPVTVEGAALGRFLFYDKILSNDESMSCASCHKQAFAFSDSPNVFSEGSNGKLSKRNTMPIFNLAWRPSLFWDGRAESIEAQIFHPVRGLNEMNNSWLEVEDRVRKKVFYAEKFKESFPNQKIDSVLISKAIAQFLRTLISYQSKYDRVLGGGEYFSEAEYRGFVKVNDQSMADCLHCHSTDDNALGTRNLFVNNGLDFAKDAKDYADRGRGDVSRKKEDYGKFATPSLRNLLFTAPYMHDGRFKTLEEVLSFYGEGVQSGVNTDSRMGLAHRSQLKMTEEDKKDILAFLYTLSDSSFISNANFSNPF